MGDINRLEGLQRNAARIVCNEYRRGPGISATALLQQLQWPSLADRRLIARLTLFFNAHTGKINIPLCNLLDRSDSRTRGANNLLLNLGSPRDCGSCRSHLWYFLSPLDGASVCEAHCAASTAVRRTDAPCAQASTAVRFSARSALRSGRPGVGISKGRKCLRSRKCIVSTNYDKNLRS